MKDRLTDAEQWEACIPSMGFAALLRNLRNFDEKGVSEDAYKEVVAKLTDPDEVAKSRQFPMRFLSAYKAVSSERWKYPLEIALNHSLANVPTLKGRTLVMVDVSGSMRDPLSERSELQRWEAAAVFGASLALRNDADLFVYDSEARAVPFKTGTSPFSLIQQVRGQVGGGTDTWAAIQSAYKGHDRVIVLTDEQTGGGQTFYTSWGGRQTVTTAVDPGTSVLPLVYTWNLAGYEYGHGRSGDRGRHVFAGLSDKSFMAIDLLEKHGASEWPF